MCCESMQTFEKMAPKKLDNHAKVELVKTLQFLMKLKTFEADLVKSSLEKVKAANAGKSFDPMDVTIEDVQEKLNTIEHLRNINLLFGAEISRLRDQLVNDRLTFQIRKERIPKELRYAHIGRT